MRPRAWPRRLVVALAVVGLALGSYAITSASLVYFSDELGPFVIEKLPLPLESVWLAALKLHVAAAAFSLPACLLLTSTSIVRRARGFHRWLGRLTGVVVLFALVPSGLYLALFAKGGLFGTLGFVLSGLVVAAAMVQGIRTARAGRMVDHRRASMHVLAQLSVAVTSRLMLLAFDTFAVDAELAYLVALWVPVVGSAALVELAIPRPRRRRAQNPNRSRRHEDHAVADRLRPARHLLRADLSR